MLRAKIFGNALFSLPLAGWLIRSYTIGTHCECEQSAVICTASSLSCRDPLRPRGRPQGIRIDVMGISAASNHGGLAVRTPRRLFRPVPDAPPFNNTRIVASAETAHTPHGTASRRPTVLARMWAPWATIGSWHVKDGSAGLASTRRTRGSVSTVDHAVRRPTSRRDPGVVLQQSLAGPRHGRETLRFDAARSSSPARG